MTLHIDVSPDMELRLRNAADREGVAPEEFVRGMLRKQLESSSLTAKYVNQAAIDLLKKWELEDATNDPAEIASRDAEFDDLKAALNRNRELSDGPNARKLFP